MNIQKNKKESWSKYDDFYAYKKVWSNDERWIKQFANSYSSEYYKLEYKSDEITNFMKVDRGNPHVLCFIEHRVVKSNLCLIELENYSLGSSFLM
jgi:diaminopimelate epimerase